MNRYIILIYTIYWIYFSHSSPICLKNERSVSWNRYFHVENRSLNITLDVTNRKSHIIVSHILRILLTERLKYHRVELSLVPWLTPSEHLRRLHGDDKVSLPKAHINLELWQPPGFNVEAWVNKGLMLDCGPLGPIARRGIFVLTETIDQMFLKYNKSYDHWRTFKYPHKSWNYTVLYNWLIKEQRWRPIKGYSLSEYSHVPIILIDREEFQKPIEKLFEKIFSRKVFRIILMHNITGSLKMIINDWIKYANNISFPLEISPVFFYDWYPSHVTVNRTYSRVLFPDCYGIQDDPLCDFEVNQLSKMVWVKLKSHAPLAYQLVNQFNILQSELVDLLNKVGDHPSYDQFHYLACEWVKRKRDVWTPWTLGWNVKQKLVIPALFSLYGKWTPGGLVQESYLELKKQNDKFFKNSSYELVLDVRNLTCVEDIVLKEYLRLSTTKDNSSTILAYLATVCSDSLESTLKVSNFQRRIVVTSSADSPKFSNISQYKYFFRTLPSMRLQMSLLLSTFYEWNWKRIVILRKDAMFYDPKFFERNGVHVLEDFKVEESRLTYDYVFESLKRIRDFKNGRVFLVEYFAESTRIIMCAAYKLNMTLDNGYVWFLNNWMDTNWNKVGTKNCTVTEILNMTSKYLMLAHRDLNRHVFGVNSDIELNGDNSSNLNSFTVFTINAIHRIAVATNILLNENPSALSVLDTPSVAERFINYIANPNSDLNKPRMSDIVEGFWVLQIVNNAFKAPVFKWEMSPNFSFNESENTISKPSILLSESKLLDFWGLVNKGLPPLDGNSSDNESECILEGMKKFIGVTCSTTIIIFNIIILVPILSVIIGCFIFFFCRLKKTQEEEGIRKPFEFLCEELAELDLPSKDVVINRTVGRGNFGIVYGGEAKQDNKWVLVAIKAISKKLDYRHKYEFLSEAKLMSNLLHDNIVKLIGICLYPENDMIYLIMEHITGGDLKKFLIKRRVKAKEDPNNDIVCPERLTKYARDIASGLSYLHQNRYLHRDVACRNCLISTDHCIKVGDFGLARKMVKFNKKGGSGYYRFSGLGAMPIRWLPPESLQFGIYSISTDIWSFGVTLFEIVTFGVFPFGGYEHEEVVDKVKRCKFTVANFLPDSFKPNKVYGIISKCCSYCSSDRYKSMQEIIDELDLHPDCVQPSLTDDPPNIKNTGFSYQHSDVESDSTAFQKKTLPKSSKCHPELSSGRSSIPNYVFSKSESAVKDRDSDLRPDGDFINGFCALDSPNLSASPTLNFYQPINVKSQSIEYIHLSDANPNLSYPITSGTGDQESDLGYVTYKTDNIPSIVNVDNTRHNYLKMSSKTTEENETFNKKFLPLHSCSLDLSTDTECSEVDYSTDKQSSNPTSNNYIVPHDGQFSFHFSPA